MQMDPFTVKDLIISLAYVNVEFLQEKDSDWYSMKTSSLRAPSIMRIKVGHKSLASFVSKATQKGSLVNDIINPENILEDWHGFQFDSGSKLIVFFRFLSKTELQYVTMHPDLILPLQQWEFLLIVSTSVIMIMALVAFILWRIFKQLKLQQRTAAALTDNKGETFVTA